jgi:hypothetical protein
MGEDLREAKYAHWKRAVAATIGVA